MSRQDAYDRRREEAKRQTMRRRRKKQKRKAARIWLTILFFVVAVLVTLSLTVLFPITEIQITGESRYTQEQIQLASGLELSQNLFFFLSSDVAGRIEKALPYIEQAKLKRELPGTIHIEVSAADEAFSYYTDSGYYVTSTTGKILRKSDTVAENTAAIRGVAIADSIPGERVAFTDDAKKELMDTLASRIADYGMQVTEIDLSNTVNIAMTVEGRIQVKLGTQADLTFKFAHMYETIKKLEPGVCGTLDLSSWSQDKAQAYFRETQGLQNTSN